jgi:hypothetical protein
VTEQSDGLKEEADGIKISDRLASVLGAELTRPAAKLLENETDPDKCWKRFREVHRELSQLRRDDHRAVRISIKRDCWNRQVECEIEEAGKRSDKEHRKRLCAPFLARLDIAALAGCFGSGEAAWNIAAYILEVRNKLPMGRLGRKGGVDQTKPSSGSPNPTQSDLIRPDQTNFSNGHAASEDYENPS